MDPLKAVEDMDKILRQVPMDREGHAHILACITTVRAHIGLGCAPLGSDTSERGPGA